MAFTRCVAGISLDHRDVLLRLIVLGHQGIWDVQEGMDYTPGVVL